MTCAKIEYIIIWIIYVKNFISTYDRLSTGTSLQTFVCFVILCDTVGYQVLRTIFVLSPISDKYCSLLCVFLGAQNCAHRIAEVILKSNEPCLSSNVLWRCHIKPDFSSWRNNYLNLHNQVTQLKIGIVLLWYMAHNFLLMLYIQLSNNLWLCVWCYPTHALQQFRWSGCLSLWSYLTHNICTEW
jgi:hypothetical protein